MLPLVHATVALFSLLIEGTIEITWYVHVLFSRFTTLYINGVGGWTMTSMLEGEPKIKLMVRMEL